MARSRRRRWPLVCGPATATAAAWMVVVCSGLFSGFRYGPTATALSYARFPTPGLRPSLHLHEQLARYDGQDSIISERTPESEMGFFVCDAQFVHLGVAARILTEEFYSQKTNFITFQLERLKTVLSLESTFPIRPNSLQEMFVACDASNGRVVGFAEVDARPLGNQWRQSGEMAGMDTQDDGDVLRSYMYNLAVDKDWKRRGVASALVGACERFVAERHESCAEKRLYLRVRKCNGPAVALYKRLGYDELDPGALSLSREDINSGSLEEGELILFARDLPVGAECVLN